jgi:fibronectin-binding protein A (FbpA)/ribosomal quality control pathway NFACT family protein
MSGIAASLAGQRVSGVVGLSPRSLAVALGGRPRSYLWIHVERKEASYTHSGELPIPPDPRGSRYGGLEDGMRGLMILRTEVDADESLTLTLGSEEGGGATHTLALTTSGLRSNLVLSALPDGPVLWAFHRDVEGAAEGAEGESAPPPSFHRPHARAVEGAAEVEELRASIERAFLEDFERDLAHELNAAERSLTRRLEAQGGDLERTRAHMAARRWGEILLAHYRDIPRGASRVRLPDTFADSPGATVEIALDPALTPQDNAARLFQRAKKGERGARLVEKRLAQTRKSLAGLAGLRRDIETHPPKEALRLLDDFLREAGLRLKARGDTRKIHLGRRTPGAPRPMRPGRRSPGARESIRPRTLFTSDGWEVWVGRNNSDNDRITHRLSNPHDLWFHVVGVPGSHVILRRPTRNATPKPRTLEEAAAIAAYYSKARKLSRVPVVFTERKFVSKPRRGKPGQAICTRERELLVRPGVPKTDAGN